MTNEGWQPPPYGQPPPPYGAPPPGWPPQGPPGWPPQGPAYGGYPGYGYGYGYVAYGPPGRIRPTGTSILLFICTLGIYGFVYNYSVHDEMKRHSGRGVGGGVALLLTFLANVAMPFVTPAEVGSLYERRGQRPPVQGWTGLWAILPLVGGYILFFFVAFASVVTTNGNGNDVGVGLVVFFLLWIAGAITGGIIWFVKTNDALNAYWQSMGVQG